MSKIGNAFKDGKAFIGFLTAGDPSKEKTIEYILAMEKAGCDLIEIGIPFSDPMAEGIVIQDANIRALESKTTTDDVFDIISEVRKQSDIPIVFLTYINPVLFYGYDKFFKKCGELGVDGFISPDLPYEEKGEIASYARENGVDIISLIAPTSKERIQMIASEAEGFVYVVSSLGVTGVRDEITTDLASINEVIRQTTITKTAIGFGINNPIQAKEVSKHADGVIVGSAIIKLIEKSGDNYLDAVYNYVKEMKEAINS